MLGYFRKDFVMPIEDLVITLLLNTGKLAGIPEEMFNVAHRAYVTFWWNLTTVRFICLFLTWKTRIFTLTKPVLRWFFCFSSDISARNPASSYAKQRRMSTDDSCEPCAPIRDRWRCFRLLFCCMRQDDEAPMQLYRFFRWRNPNAYPYRVL